MHTYTYIYTYIYIYIYVYIYIYTYINDLANAIESIIITDGKSLSLWVHCYFQRLKTKPILILKSMTI